MHNILNTYIYQIPHTCFTILGEIMILLGQKRYAYTELNTARATAFKICFYVKFTVLFLQCLQQHVMHVLVCWVMDQSNYPTYQDTETTQ